MRLATQTIIVMFAALALVSACTLFVDTNGFAGDNPRDQPAEASVLADVDQSDVAPSDSSANDAADGVGFRDDFARADGETIGNGWMEKTPEAYSLLAGQVVRSTTTNTDYRSNMVFRPSSEDLLDVVISIELDAWANGAHPQIFVRAQRGTIAQNDEYDGYLFYINGDGTNAVIGRQRGDVFVVTIGEIAVSPPLQPTKRYRMTASALGQAPVALQFTLERFEAGAWVSNGEVTASDSSPMKIVTPGAVGFSADNTPNALHYDNFTWKAL